MQHLIWMRLESWKLEYPIFSYKWTMSACFKALAREHSYSYTLDGRLVLSSSWEGHPLQPSAYLQEGGSVREEGDTHLASQISQVNPGDQWGDRCSSQITLTSDFLTS